MRMNRIQFQPAGRNVSKLEAKCETVTPHANPMLWPEIWIADFVIYQMMKKPCSKKWTNLYLGWSYDLSAP